MSEGWQRVLTVHEYYDGPVFGIVEFRGTPHVYERQWDTALDEYGEIFLLSPIEPDLLALIMEDWEIWLRWDAAFKRGEADVATHPALPADQGRHQEIQRLIDHRLEAKRGGPIRQYATLKVEEGAWWLKWSDRQLPAK